MVKDPKSLIRGFTLWNRLPNVRAIDDNRIRERVKNR